MSATAAVKEKLDSMKPRPDQTVESFARELFSMQAEIYNAYVMGDLGMRYDYISEEDKRGWIEAARKKFGPFPDMTLSLHGELVL
jgi:hypothetical protein